MWRIWIALVIVALAGDAAAAPRDEIASPSQATRDAAAQKLRATFKRTPKSKLVRLVKAIKKPGMTKTKTLKLLAPYRPRSEGGGASGGGETIMYRIDPSWILECYFSERDDRVLSAPRLVESLQEHWVEPPADFTGVWTTYLANGQRAHEIHYAHGKPAGTWTRYDDTGAVISTKEH